MYNLHDVNMHPHCNKYVLCTLHGLETKLKTTQPPYTQDQARLQLRALQGNHYVTRGNNNSHLSAATLQSYQASYTISNPWQYEWPVIYTSYHLNHCYYSFTLTVPYWVYCNAFKATHWTHIKPQWNRCWKKALINFKTQTEWFSQFSWLLTFFVLFTSRW